MTPSKLWLLILLPALFLAGCGKEAQRTSAELGSGNLRWSSFPVEIKVDAFLLSDYDATVDLQDAISFWETKAGKPLFSVVGAWDNATNPYTGRPENPEELLGNVIFFQGPWPFDPKIAGKTIVHSSNGVIESSVIFLNADTHLCAYDCSIENGDVSRRKLIAHELGHFIGLGHSGDMADIMYPEILPNGQLSGLNVNDPLLRRLTN